MQSLPFKGTALPRVTHSQGKMPSADNLQERAVVWVARDVLVRRAVSGSRGLDLPIRAPSRRTGLRASVLRPEARVSPY